MKCTLSRATLTLLFACTAAQARTVTILHEFTGGTDGASPQAPFVAGPDGTLYSTTAAGGGGPCFSALDVAGCGTIFALTPPSAGQAAWTETILYKFINMSDGYSPVAGLFRDAQGNLYGTTQVGGDGPGCGLVGCGTVFRLSPPPAGQSTWTKTILYNFQGATDGAQPVGRVIMDPAGALLGTASLGASANCADGCGVVFRLAPPPGGKGAWTQTVLHAFRGNSDGANPYGALLAGPHGSYFGTTTNGGTDKFDCEDVGCGTVFQILPPRGGATAWRERVLHRFTRQVDGADLASDLIQDAAGNLYGTAQEGGGAPFNGGTVFRLAPPKAGQTGWTVTVLHAFGFGTDGNLPAAGVIGSANGTLYGTTIQGGTAAENGLVFALHPPKGGTGTWRETQLYRFPNSGPGGMPMAALLLGAHGTLYGTSFDDTAFSLAP